LVSSSVKNPFSLLLFAVATLFLGAAFIYISIKAPFYWGAAFLPGVLLLVIFAITALASLVSMLRRPARLGS